VIALDTNQVLTDSTLDGPVFVILKALAESTGHSLVLPSLVIEEAVADYERRVRKIGQQVEANFTELKRLIPWWPEHVPSAPLPAQAAIEYGRRLSRMLPHEALPLNGDDARDALLREVERELPASTDPSKPGSGARDAAIWLTVLRAGADRGSRVYFVSNDKRAFGEVTLHPVLAQEATRRGADLVYCPDLPTLFGHLADHYEVSVLTSSAIVTSPMVEIAVKTDLTDPTVFFEVIPWLPSPSGATSWSDDMRITLVRQPQTITAYAVGDTVWASAKLRWSVIRPFTREPERWEIRYEVTTTVLARLGANDEVTGAQVMSRGPLDQVAPVLVGIGPSA